MRLPVQRSAVVVGIRGVRGRQTAKGTRWLYDENCMLSTRRQQRSTGVRKGMAEQKRPRYASGLWVFGACADRFCTAGYKPKNTVQEQIALAAGVPLLEGVE